MDQKMLVHFLSAECYPCAKTGGLADVVGALPKYLNLKDCEVKVFMPKYKMPWFEGKVFTSIYAASFVIGGQQIAFEVQKYAGNELGFNGY